MSTPQDLPIAPAREPAGRALTLLPGLIDEVAEDQRIEDLLREAAPRLHRYATRRLGDSHEAEELVQEALLRAFEHQEVLRSLDDVMAWCTVVVGRLVIDRLRVRGRAIAVGSGADLPEPPRRRSRDTAEIVTAREEARLALDSLEALPHRQAAVLWAREVEGLSYEDIAARHAMTESTVRSLLMRARRALRKEFALRGGTVPVGGLVLLAPWLVPLRAAHRLKLAAVTTGAIASVIAAAVVSVLVLPQHQAQAAVPVAPAATGVGHPLGATHPARPVAAAHRAAAPDARPAAVVRPARTPPRPAAPAPKPTAPTAVPVVPSTCLSGLGVDCAAPDSASSVYLSVPPQLTDPIHVRDAAINLGVPCTRLPATPATSCGPGR